MAVYCSTTTINGKKPHSQAVGEPGGGGFFLLLTLSELCLLHYTDKLLHTLHGDRQADSREDSYLHRLCSRGKKKHLGLTSFWTKSILFNCVLFLLEIKHLVTVSLLGFWSCSLCKKTWNSTKNASLSPKRHPIPTLFTWFDSSPPSPSFPQSPAFPVVLCCSPQLSLALWIPSLKQWAVAGTLLLTMVLKACCLPIARVFISWFIYPVLHLSECR